MNNLELVAKFANWLSYRKETSLDWYISRNEFKVEWKEDNEIRSRP